MNKKRLQEALSSFSKDDFERFERSFKRYEKQFVEQLDKPTFEECGFLVTNYSMQALIERALKSNASMVFTLEVLFEYLLIIESEFDKNGVIRPFPK